MLAPEFLRPVIEALQSVIPMLQGVFQNGLLNLAVIVSFLIFCIGIMPLILLLSPGIDSMIQDTPVYKMIWGTPPDRTGDG
ncbi:MAG: hypothetical protein HRU17_20145 [Polyangiaceae bacterium]|nr:hypothetical protein [Polyangiaceae bacterium]